MGTVYISCQTVRAQSPASPHLISMSDTESVEAEEEFQPSIDVSALPIQVKNRVKALKKLQLESIEVEAEYYREVHALDIKYQKLYDAINVRRSNIVAGRYEPAGDEIDWPSEDEDEEDEEEKLTNSVAKIYLKDYDENSKGIPHFWKHALKNGNEEALMGLVESCDEPILESLIDVTVSLNTPENTGFSLEFHFSENEYFTNSKLIKTYEIRNGPDPDSPLVFDGPEIIRCTGCKINWKEGKDVTKKTVKLKKLKARKGGDKKTLTREVSADSFFNFFSPPAVPDDPKTTIGDDDRATLAVDFDVGFAIKEKLIARAVLYFTGEFYVDDEDFEDCPEEEDESEDDGEN